MVYTEIGICPLRESIVNNSNHKICFTVIGPASRTRLLSMEVMNTCIDLRRNLITHTDLKHLTFICITGTKSTICSSINTCSTLPH